MDVRSTEQLSSKIFRIINSTACFILAYIVTTHSQWFVMSAIGHFFKFDSWVYYYGIKFMLNGGYWNRLNVGFIYGGSTLYLLLFGLAGIYLFDKFKNYKTSFSLFLLWCFVIGTSLFSVQMLIAAIGYGEYNSPFYTGLAVAMAWIRIPLPVVYLLVVPFTIMFIYFVINFGRPFLSLAYSYTRVNKLSRRRQFILETIIVPFLIGAVVVSGLIFPMNFYVHLTYMLTLFVACCGVWFVMSYVEILKDEVLRYKSLQKISFIALILVGLAVLWVQVTFRGVFMPV